MKGTDQNSSEISIQIQLKNIRTVSFNLVRMILQMTLKKYLAITVKFKV